jgi:hypothetical protein
MAKYNLNDDEKQFLQTLGGNKPQDEKLYGFIPGTWLPNWVKQGYNQSIEGMAQQIIQGKPVFTTDKYYNPSVLEDIGAGIMSFLTPTDFATMVLGGGIGGAAVKSSAKRAVQLLVKQKGVSQEVAERAISIGSKRWYNQAREKAITGAAGLSFYSGLQSGLGQKITDDDISFTKTLKDAALGGTLGGASAGLGITTRAVAKAKGFGPRSTFATEKAAEVGVFGTVDPLIQGELPTAEGYIRAAGTIGGLTLSGAAARRVFNPRSRNLAPDELEKFYKQTAESRFAEQRERQLKGEIWTDGKRKVRLLTDLKPKDAGDTVLNVREVGRTKVETIPQSQFIKKEKEGGFRLFQNADGENMDNKIKSRSLDIAKDLKMDDNTFERILEDAADEGFTVKRAKVRETLRRAKKRKSIRKTDKRNETYNLLKDDYQARVKVLRTLERKQYLEKSTKELRDLDLDVREWTGKSIFETALPKSIYTVLTSTLPIPSRVKDPLFQVGFKDIQNLINKIDVDRAVMLRKYDYQIRNEAVYTARDGTVYKGLDKIGGRSKKNKQLRLELAEDLQNPEAANRVKGYRKVLDDIYNDSKRLGVPVAKYEDFYLSRMIRGDLLKQVRDDINKLGGTFDIEIMKFKMEDKANFNQRLTDALNGKTVSNVTREAIEDIKQLMKIENPNSTPTSAKAFEFLRSNAIKEVVYNAKNLEIGRKAKLPSNLYEKDAGVILTRYIGQATKRQGFVKNAGVKGEIVYDKIAALKSLGGHKEAELLYKALGSVTGSIEIDKNYNWSPTAKNVLNDLVNIQVATKIGLGFATIPNLTQSFISSVLKAGYGPFFQGSYKMLTDKNYREQIKKYAGASSLELNSMIVGFNPENMSFTAKAAERLTQWSGFQKINDYNKLISAYTGYEAALKWQRIAKTSKNKLRKDWATSNLKQMGIRNVNEKLTQKKLAGAMYEFSRDTQLQRNVFREPAFFNDPRFQPFVLFKRFGYRQFEWLQGELRKEVSQGNLAILLRLGVAGVAGGYAVGWARNALSDLLAGKFDESIFGQEIGSAKDVYSEAFSMSVDGKNYSLSDFIDAFASVGAMGIVGDILASESRWRALEFAAKPAIIQDAGKAYTAFQKLIADVETFGPTGITLQRSLRNVAPMAGSAARRVLERFETPKQRQDYVKFRLGRTRARILDAMIDGNDDFAKRLIVQWNSSFPERLLTYDDIGPQAINKRLLTKYKKQINP